MYTLFPYPTLFRSASAVRRAAPGSNAEHWVTEADEQIRRSRLGTPAGDNARDSLLAAQRSDASYLGLPAAVDRFVDASADAAVRGIRDKDDRLAAARVRSEEHTSELQSLMRISYAVFCLKKKKNITHIDTQTNDPDNNRHTT